MEGKTVECEGGYKEKKQKNKKTKSPLVCGKWGMVERHAIPVAVKKQKKK